MTLTPDPANDNRKEDPEIDPILERLLQPTPDLTPEQREMKERLAEKRVIDRTVGHLRVLTTDHSRGRW